MQKSVGRLPGTVVFGFALGSAGAGVYSTVPTVLLLYYCTEVLSIAPAAAALIVFIPKAWAILWDPAVGAWSDRSNSRMGRRAPFILMGSLGVAVSFALLFNTPQLGMAGTIGYVFVVYFLMATVYSVFAVPYIAIPAEITSAAAERERLMAWRMALALIGVLIGASAAPYLVTLAGGGRHGYGTMALIIAAFCGVAMLVTFRTVQVHHTRDAGQSLLAVDLKAGLRLIAADRDYKRLWLAYLLCMSGVALSMAMVPYFVTRVLSWREADIGSVLLALLGASIVAIPLWTLAMHRFGGWRSFIVASVAYAVIAATFAVLTPSTPAPAVALMFVALGLPFAGIQVVPFTLLAHIAHAGAAAGARQEGLYTGIWTAGEKLALAIGPAAAAAGLAMSGYISGASEQTEGVRAGLHTVMAFGPAVFLIAGLAILRRRWSQELECTTT